MKRREFIVLGSAAGLATAILPATVASSDLDSNRSMVADAIMVRRKEVHARITAATGRVHLRHPRFLNMLDIEPDSIYNATVIEFRSDGNITFSNGKQLRGKRGEKFKLLCFRNRQTGAITKKVLLRAMTREDLLAVRSGRRKGAALRAAFLCGHSKTARHRSPRSYREGERGISYVAMRLKIRTDHFP